MTNKRFDQTGFSAIEGLLIIIIIAILALVGYYVWNAQNQANKTLDTASKVSQSSPKKTAKKTAKKTSIHYLTIKEWGVRGKISSSVTPQYTVTGDANQVWADLSSDELIAADSQCDVQRQAGGVINRAKATDHVFTQAGDDTGQTVQQEIDSGVLKGYKKVGVYYYWFDAGQATCGDTQAAQDVQARTQDAIKQAILNFEAIPQP